MEDDRLRLIFTCCHPALAPEAQVALTLRLIAGLQTPEIARAFPRPRGDNGAADRAGQEQDPRRHIPYRVPDDAELPARMRPVLAEAGVPPGRRRRREHPSPVL